MVNSGRVDELREDSSFSYSSSSSFSKNGSFQTLTNYRKSASLRQRHLVTQTIVLEDEDDDEYENHRMRLRRPERY
jgi:hypothetical protein